MAHTDINSEDRLVQAAFAVHLEKATIITENYQQSAFSLGLEAKETGIGDLRKWT